MNHAKNYVEALHATLQQLPYSKINQVIEHLHQARIDGRKTFVMGNGGSASTASHLVCDLAKNTRVEGWTDFRVIGLSDNMALMSAYANDEGYETVFARQLAGLVEQGDVVIAISTSGNSPNVVEAVELANYSGALTIGMTGFDGGRLGQIVDLHIHVPSSVIEQVEDIHLMVEHLVTKALRERALAEAPILKTSDERMEYGINGKTDLSMFRDVVNTLTDQSDLSQVLQRTLDLAVVATEADSGSILSVDRSGRVTDGAISYKGKIRRHPTKELAAFMKQGLAGWVANNGQAALISDTSQDPRWMRSQHESSNKSSRSALCVPLINGQGLVGVMTVVNNPPVQFTQKDLGLLMALAVLVSMNGAPLFSEIPNPVKGESVDARNEIGRSKRYQSPSPTQATN